MRRRDFIKVIACSTAGWPLAVHAQQSQMPVIGYLSARSREDTTHLIAAFQRGLAENGFVEAQNVRYRIPLCGRSIRQVAGDGEGIGAAPRDCHCSDGRRAVSIGGKGCDLDHPRRVRCW
jgi:hypothetical protein